VRPGELLGAQRTGRPAFEALPQDELSAPEPCE